MYVCINGTCPAAGRKAGTSLMSKAGISAFTEIKKSFKKLRAQYWSKHHHFFNVYCGEEL